MANDGRLDAADSERIGSTIGQVECARLLFKPRVDGETVALIADAVLGGLKIRPASLDVISDMAQLPSDRVKSWATQSWINVIGDL